MAVFFPRYVTLWRKIMDEAQEANLKRSEKVEDEAIAHSLAAALCEDDVEKFLQLYDEIPEGVSLERLGNIKEMARQLAAVARNYRYSPTPVKDSTHFGINHTLQTSPLMLNGELNIPDLSVFKTPPEGPTPVDQKNFCYDEETLKTLQVAHNFSLSFYDKQLNDSGISQQEYLDTPDDDAKQCSKTNEAEAIRSNDDDAFEFYTPPEDENIEGPPFGYPPSSDKLIKSVITLLSKTATDSEICEENCLQESENIVENENEPGKEDGEFFEAYDVKDSQENDVNVSLEKNASTLEGDSPEKDSSDGSPHSRRSFTQEEDDSGISIVDENDIVQESTITNGGHFEAKKEQIENTNERSCVETNHSGNSPSQRTSAKKKSCYTEPESKYTNDTKYNQSNDSDIKYTKSNSYENEDTSIGWQTRHKRMSKRRHDKEYERMGYYNENTEKHRSNHKESTSRRSTSKNKDRNQAKVEKGEGYSTVTERQQDERYKERNAWKRGEDGDENLKRSGRRGGQNGKKSESKYTKNGNKEKYSDLEKHENQHQNTKPQYQASVFSYRDALLKAGSAAKSNINVPSSTKEQISSNTDKMFNVEAAVNYLSTVWTSVNNLHKKDPSKVYIYNGDEM